MARTRAPFQALVREDALSGLRSGVLGTPTFFVNGRRLEGGFRPDELESAMELAVRAGPAGLS
jgi:protein-disulfide isomerase